LSYVQSLAFSVKLGLIATAITGCSFPELKMPRVHKISVQQGNLITQEMVDQLKPGMTRSQVAYIMGEPIFRSTFRDDRWDYVYTLNVPGYFEREMKMSLYFEDDALAYFTGDLSPSEAAETPEGETEQDNADTQGNNQAASG
jgi:outer membrane protein assembly factor BamE